MTVVVEDCCSSCCPVRNCSMTVVVEDCSSCYCFCHSCSSCKGSFYISVVNVTVVTTVTATNVKIYFAR